MRILVYDVAASSGGALTVLNSFYEEFCKDTKNEYIFVLSVCKLKEQPHIKVLNFPWIKKSPLHRMYFDQVLAHKLVKKYHADKVLSLQNIELPHAGVPQIVYEHNALPFSEYKFRLQEAFRPWYSQQILGRMMKRSIRRAEQVLVQTNWKMCIRDRTYAQMAHNAQEGAKDFDFSVLTERLYHVIESVE